MASNLTTGLPVMCPHFLLKFRIFGGQNTGNRVENAGNQIVVGCLVLPPFTVGIRFLKKIEDVKAKKQGQITGHEKG